MVESDLPLALETTKIESPVSGQYLTIVFVVLNSRAPRERESVMVQQQPVVRQLGVQKQQHQEHQGLSMSRACKPTPLKVSRAEMMQEQKRHTHFTHMCMHPPQHARTCACTHPCTRAHTCTQTCVHRCTHKHTRKGTCMRVHTCMHKHACTNLSLHANVYAHARTHACIQP